MKTNNEEIGALKNHINNLNLQIEVLAAKQQNVATVGARLSQEAQRLREQKLQATRQMREIELHRSGMYMWENIGCGG